MTGLVIIGAGPGVGAAVARRFAREGLPVAAIARTQSTVDTVLATISGVPTAGFTADAADEASLRSALDLAVRAHGTPDAVVYNAAIIQRDTPGELSVSAHLAAWSVNVLGALTTAAHLTPAMTRGTFLITGGMPTPDPRYTSLSLGKAGVRALTTLLTQHHPTLHIATVTIAGPVAPGTPYDPDAIANHYWHLHTQPHPDWQQEILIKN